ncbi:MAG: sensor histidine kinase [Lachnospiraceae bacterium]|nr:sensor histidine kinase [Lachnospiraceae bacterium]
MKKNNRWKYISNRTFLLMLAAIGFLAVQTLVQCILFFRDEAPIWQAALLFVFTAVFTAAFWIFVVRPYQRTQMMMGRILDGYILPDSSLFEKALLTPSMEAEIERLEQVLKSPEMMDLNKRQAQYLALQNQINPHFLYNTLESIRGEALIAGMDNIADMTEALAKFFRYTITKVENLVSVEEELDNCETYFLIQKYRFGSRLQLHILYEEESRESIMNCKIPKLTLQPILENSIIHGTELKIGTGNLTIQFEQTDKRLIIRISDDGAGMDEQTLAKLNRQLGRGGRALTDQEEKRGGIALVNVNNRIHLLFGEEYGMHIYSIKGKGTDVEVTLPVVTA